MSQQRIKGQEIFIIVTRGGVVEETLTDIQNFNMEMQLETKEEGYLGETANRFDDIYNGVKFDFEIHLHTQKWWNFQKAIIDRARRITPDIQFNITGLFSFPNGEQPSATLVDCKFGAQPLSISSRGDYVKVKLSGACSEFDIQQS